MVKRGRPTKYTDQLGDKICAELAQGRSLSTVCKSEDMPSTVTVFAWFKKYPDFLNNYARAKQESADAMAEEILDISDDARNDWMEVERKDGSTYMMVDHEHISRSKLRVDTRKFLMAKLKPKKYGDQVDVTSGGEKIDAVVIYRPEKLEE